MNVRGPHITRAAAALVVFLAMTGLVGCDPGTSGYVSTRIAVAPDIQPTAMKFAPDGRLFVLEQTRGRVRIVEDDRLRATPVLRVPVQTGGSRGLLGIAFHPQFVSNGLFYLNYTTNSGGYIHNRVSRFTVVGDTANPASEVVIFEGEDLGDQDMHYGGDINIGPDSRLYISTGDRLIANRAQSLNSTFGKILRIDKNGSIPTSNPFYGQTTGINRAIWALGLRNPFRFGFQRGTSRMFIADVGAKEWEEINQGRAGANYGWPIHEGPSNEPGFTSPLFAYPHQGAGLSGCAVMGGDFYNPDVVQFPSALVGTYIFADLCRGWMKSVDFAHGNNLRSVANGLEEPLDMKVDPNTGALYYITRFLEGRIGGGLFRVDYRGALPLAITRHPESATVPTNGDATFSVDATGTPPLRYQWRRNGTNIAGATASSYTVTNAQRSQSGSRYTVRVSDETGSVVSNVATLTVTSNVRPTATITAPPVGGTYVAGTQITASGTGTDPEDGTLPPSAFTWEVVFHHHPASDPHHHTHPFIDPVSGSRSLTFTIPNNNETEADVYYRIHLTVRDSAGATHEVFRDILPRTSQLTFATRPAGLELTLDDQPISTPTTTTSVEGIRRDLGAPSPQTLGGTTYVFQAWSDGRARSHTITTPTANTTYTATFVPA